MYSLYLIECKTPKHLYVGISSKPVERIETHRKGYGAKFTRLHGFNSSKIITTFECEEEAKKAEWDIVKDLRGFLGDDYVIAGAGACQTKPASIRNRSSINQQASKSGQAYLMRQAYRF